MKLNILILACPLLLTSCVPMIKPVYKTPRVSGTVLDVVTMKALQGVVVSHDGYDEPRTVTDENGYFDLPSISNVEFVLLMAGHSIKGYGINFTTSLSSASLLLGGSLMMLHEEDHTLSIVMDPTRRKITEPPIAKFASYQQLMESVEDDTLYEHCSRGYGINAVFDLNTARKVYHHQKQFPKSELLQQSTKFNYEKARKAWDAFYASCKDDPALLKNSEAEKARQALYDLIKEETDSRFEISGEQPYPFIGLYYDN